ncbi:glycerophosphodiester phosphodiesterase family protein [Sphingobacterium haloxyli]|uniref:Glycerophosphodiester phosphodiesterase n=1 Tax=Sphingobacterium haloxyli TaxID=2100533 RepID=A0A2S9J054_9SPHI|nr:glycerophosphodiester phosphodiesterase family protein [Sphingobacterium haloxyli]PRD46128.1 glycerophosphodiester phosphodiesterase [Sphingobacterium haloxyli]
MKINPIYIIALFGVMICILISCNPGGKGVHEEKTNAENPIAWEDNTPKVMVAAHRGDWIHAPENSLKGFRHCIEAGVDIIETDVQISKDGVPVILHDTTLNRTTDGDGAVREFNLVQLKRFRLKDATGILTDERIPTLEETMLLTKGKTFVYLDKSKGKIDKILPVLEKTGTLSQSMFVLDYSYDEAQKQFGDYLDQVIFVPVISDKTIKPESYVKEYMDKLRPKAFQFRIADETSPVWKLVKMVSSDSRAFIAATWSHHSAGHDDYVSRKNPELGWGWLMDKGVSIIETNHPDDLQKYIKGKSLHE